MASETVLSCAQLLAKKKLTIAFAESATGGRAAAEFALTPVSGEILLGGLVCYDACVKEDLLKVSADLVRKYSPESCEVTAALARNLKRLIPASITVGITGLLTAGGSETPEKPVGSMFIHIFADDWENSKCEVFTGDPQTIVLQAIDLAAGLIIEKLNT